jgi:hypothetical protein
MKIKTEKGENLPEEVLRCISEWCSVLEDRNTVPGGSLGGIMGGVAAFEGSLASKRVFLAVCYRPLIFPSSRAHFDYSPSLVRLSASVVKVVLIDMPF